MIFLRCENSFEIVACSRSPQLQCVVNFPMRESYHKRFGYATVMVYPSVESRIKAVVNKLSDQEPALLASRQPLVRSTTRRHLDPAGLRSVKGSICNDEDGYLSPRLYL